MNININNYEAYFLDYHEGNLSPQEVADLFLFLSQHPELKKELEDFENIELNDFSNPVFQNKEALKKNITPDNQEEYFIRAIEETLDANELILLHSYLASNPQFLKDFNLFQKTKLQADPSLVFENKNELKQLTKQDQTLISSIEGLLNKKEQAQLEKELAHNPKLKKAFLLYQYTKFIADPSIVYTNKHTLKRKDRKVIPFFYYVSSAAAAVAILIGLFFIFRTTSHLNTHQEVAQQKITPTAQPSISSKTTTSKIPAVKTENVSNVKKQIQQITPEKQEEGAIAESKTAVETVVSLTPSHDTNNSLLDKQNASAPIDSILLKQPVNTIPDLVKIEKKSQQLKAAEFPSIQDVLITNLKKKLIGAEELADQKENNPSPAKINGWDIAGVFAKGISKLTGKKIAVKPQFNKAGEITAYALSAGKIEFSRVK